jgi:hypothetical protein
MGCLAVTGRTMLWYIRMLWPTLTPAAYHHSESNKGGGAAISIHLRTKWLVHLTKNVIIGYLYFSKLKRQCHEIFEPRFFNTLKYFQIQFRIS